LIRNQIGPHTHPALCFSGEGTSPSPQGNFWGASTALTPYAPGSSANAQLNASAMQSSGQSQPHDNMLPFLTVNFIISLAGTVPPRT